MWFLPRLLAPVIMMMMMCGMAAPQAGRPEGIPSPDDTWTLPNRAGMNANTVTIITAPAGGATATGPTKHAPAQAIDPVCGMTVPATAASFPLAHDGVTYYFCCANCRRRFEQDPAAYASKETRC